MSKVVALCKDCNCCPVVEFHEGEVWLGEEGNRVRLSGEQWNSLVELVEMGEIGKVP